MVTKRLTLSEHNLIINSYSHRLILDVFFKLSFTAVQRLFRYTLCSVYPNTHRLTGNTCCRTVHARWTRCNDWTKILWSYASTEDVYL